MTKTVNKIDYDTLALIEAEKRGVINYHVRVNTLVYDTNYPQERNTYRVVINLNTGKERRAQRSKYYKTGNDNICC